MKKIDMRTEKENAHNTFSLWEITVKCHYWDGPTFKKVVDEDGTVQVRPESLHMWDAGTHICHHTWRPSSIHAVSVIGPTYL